MRPDVDKMEDAVVRLWLFALGGFAAYGAITFVGFVILAHSVVFFVALVVFIPWLVQCVIVQRRINTVKRNNRKN